MLKTGVVYWHYLNMKNFRSYLKEKLPSGEFLQILVVSVSQQYQTQPSIWEQVHSEEQAVSRPVWPEYIECYNKGCTTAPSWSYFI